MPASIFAIASRSSSWSSIASERRHMSTSGRNAVERPYDEHRPSTQVCVVSRIDSRNSCRSRDFPMPASPTTNTTWPLPARAASNASRSAASSGRRPASGVRPRSARASSSPRSDRALTTS